MRAQNNPTNPLIDAAREARARAYAPYSRFKVGAAVKDDRGQVTTGSNVENASYGLTCCAERVAIFGAISDGAKRILELAVACPIEPIVKPEKLMPCGACRQVMQEFMDGSALVHVDGVGTMSLNEILPRPFHLDVGT